MNIYRSRYTKYQGTHAEAVAAARREYHAIQKRTPRRAPYVRSQYFRKDKIFINTFWDHLKQKAPAERSARIRFYHCALDLLRNTSIAPVITKSQESDIELCRFYGQTTDGIYFCVQVKSNIRNHRKDFMSVFSVRKPT